MKNIDKKIYELHSELCKTLSNPIRLEILSQLREGEKSVSELVDALKIRQANLSQHLAVLRQRKIVIASKKGTNVFYKISNPKIVQACDLIREVLFEQLAETEELAKLVRAKK
ncbi:MAG: winged helix-turn-helix transcriptional regulator [archaeon]|nr:winged helix-turn-helix transcriptional regulator [archaeon]MCP8320365.1 winged helix-turn-helix transcriptional regulator [archaeon]